MRVLQKVDGRRYAGIRIQGESVAGPTRKMPSGAGYGGDLGSVVDRIRSTSRHVAASRSNTSRNVEIDEGEICRQGDRAYDVQRIVGVGSSFQWIQRSS